MLNSKDTELRARAESVIPGGMYGHQSVTLMPPGTPQFFAKAKGAHLWDHDGNQYIDLMSGYGPNLFGYGHEEIDAAYVKQMKEIDCATSPSGVMVDLAEAFTRQVTHADWAMFCKNGTDATTMALMVARAYRGRRKILVADGTYHGAGPWCTPLPTGTVEEDRAHIIKYRYNDVASLEAAAAEAGDDLAGIFATPHRHELIEDNHAPELAYAKAVRAICDKQDALMVIDDVRAGFRKARDCSWTGMGVQPDLSAWGKAIANGHPLSCLLGNEKAKAAAGSVYVTGSFWFAAAAMAASLETLKLIKESDYLERITAMGERLRAGLTEACSGHSLDMRQSGPAQMPLIVMNGEDGQPHLKLTMAFAERMVASGVYFHPFHNMFINAAMTDTDIDQIVERAGQAAASLPALASYEVSPIAEIVFAASVPA